MVQWIDQHSLTIARPIQVSPRGFKANLEIVLDALTQLGLSTTVLAKLPHGNSWLEDLKRYSQRVHPTPDIYLLSRRSLPVTDWFTRVPLPDSHLLQGEYTLLVVSEQVGLMVLGQRETPQESAEAGGSEAEERGTEETSSLPRVNLYLTQQSALVQQKVDEFHQIIQASFAEQSHQPTVKALLGTWGDRLRVPDQSEPALMDAVLMHHAEHQERLRLQARSYRRQAMTATNLSTQNEVLLNTLRLKDDFLNTVGQELRTPLSTIKTALPLLSSTNLKPNQRQRYLDMISQECDRQSSLINGVLNLLQLERSLATATPEPLNLFDIVPGVVSTYQPIAQEKGIRMAYTVPNTLPRVCCPEAWLRQIVIHLLNNSIRYTEAGGEVWVTAQVEDEECILLNVKDTGIGIPSNELPHIFEHFYRGRQPTQDDEGAGLGLTIVQQLLLYCGGQISVESQPNVGTHVKVRLPLYHED